MVCSAAINHADAVPRNPLYRIHLGVVVGPACEDYEGAGLS